MKLTNPTRTQEAILAKLAVARVTIEQINSALDPDRRNLTDLRYWYTEAQRQCVALATTFVITPEGMIKDRYQYYMAVAKTYQLCSKMLPIEA